MTPSSLILRKQTMSIPRIQNSVIKRHTLASPLFSVAWRKEKSKQKLERCHLKSCRYLVQGNSWSAFLQALVTINHTTPQSRRNSNLAGTWALFGGILFTFTNTSQERKRGETNKNSDKMTLKRSTAYGVRSHSSDFLSQCVCCLYRALFVCVILNTLQSAV